MNTTIYTMPQKIKPVRIQQSCGINNSITSNLPITCHTSVTLTVSATVLYMAWYKIVITLSCAMPWNIPACDVTCSSCYTHKPLSYAIRGKTTKIIKNGLK